jgi:hypothetical protein
MRSSSRSSGRTSIALSALFILGERRSTGLLNAVFAKSSLAAHSGYLDFLVPGGMNPGVVRPMRLGNPVAPTPSYPRAIS